MRAAFYERTGAADEVIQIGELPDPVPAAGDVLVGVRASGINPSDTKRRAGWHSEALEYRRVTPHSDGAGVIEAVGDGVDGTRLGERVWLYNAQRGRAMGTCAEFVALPAEQAVRLPDETPFEIGACLGVPAFTAHFAVFADGPVGGQVVLVSGGAGAVGSFAIQLAKHDGATVITTVSSAEKAAEARRAGADHVMNYRAEDVVAKVMELTDGVGVDRIIDVDFGANVAIDAELIRPNGVIASYSSTRVPEPVFPYYPLAYKGVTLRLVQAYILPPRLRAKGTEDICAALSKGALRPTIANTFPLAETAAAHLAAEAGAIGKVVVVIPG